MRHTPGNKQKQAFTLVELMVVAIIIAILAAVAIPLMSGNKERAAATEGQAGCGVVRTALRVYYAENDAYPSSDIADVTTLPGIEDGDLDGVYFNDGSYAVTVSGGGYSITATGVAGPAAGKTVILSSDGQWTGTLVD